MKKENIQLNILGIAIYKFLWQINLIIDNILAHDSDNFLVKIAEYIKCHPHFCRNIHFKKGEVRCFTCIKPTLSRKIFEIFNNMKYVHSLKIRISRYYSLYVILKHFNS